MNTEKRYYKDERLNRLAHRNGGCLFSEATMLEMLEDGSLLDHWDIPDEEIFGPDKAPRKEP